MRRLLSLSRLHRRATLDRKRQRRRSKLHIGQLPGWICPLLETLEPRRLLAAGDIDSTFGNAGVVSTSFGSSSSDVFALAVQTDGKIVAAGEIPGQGYAVTRYNTDGSLDTSFGSGGSVIIDSGGGARQVAVAPNGNIVVVGDRNAGSAEDTLVIQLTSNGAFDANFGTNGEETLGLGFGGGLAINSAGTIFVAGDGFGTYNVARLNADGSLDTTFGNHGIASLPAQPFANGNVHDLALQTDGKIVVGGTGGTSGTSPDFAVVRFNSDGTPDTSFGSGGAVQTAFRGIDEGDAMSVQSDGKILLGGSSYRPPNGAGYDLAMARYNSDGSLDTTFGNGGQVLDTFGSDVSMIFNMLVEPNGKIVAAGQADGVAALFRFNSDGTLDTTFGNGGVALSLQNTTGVDVGEGRALVEQSDGKYVMASDQFTLERFVGETPPITSGISDVNVSENSPATVIALPNDFQGGSVAASQLSYSITSDSDPALFASTNIDPQTGNLTLVYAVNQIGTAQLTVRATDPDGAYVEASFQVTLSVGQTLAPGSLDPTFGNGGVVATSFGGQYPMVTQIVQQADGKLVAVGLEPSVGFAAARYNTDGSLDTSFGNSGTVTIGSTHTAFHVALQADGKILLSGDLNTFPDETEVVRLNANGSLDSSFGVDGRVMLDIGAGYGGLAVDPQGRIDVATDNFGALNVARLNADGSLDTSFGQNGVASAPAMAMASNVVALILENDGKIVVGGDLAGNGKSDGFIAARFDSNGTPDPSFGTGGIAQVALDGLTSALTLAVQANGKILEGGSWIPPSGGTSENVIVRFTSEGTIDTTFGSGGELLDSRGGIIFDLFAEPGGSIIAAAQVNRVASVFRFHADGTPDSTFGVSGIAPASPNAAGYSMVQGRSIIEQADGKYVMAGDDFLLERFLGESPPSTSGISDVNVSENSPATVIALPNDFQGGSVPASQLAYSITADSSPSLFASVTIDPQTGNLTLAYARNQTGTAELTVRATDPDGAYVESTLNVTVSPIPDASLTPTATNFTAVEGATLTGPVATFTDADPTGVTSDFTATIDWGDKSALTTFSGSQITEMNGVFTIAGSHAYAEEGTYTLTVTVTDIGGTTATISPVAVVDDASLSATVSAVNATEESTFSGRVATFSDADPAGMAADYTATINWGDQSALTTESGSQITDADGTFSVPGSHVYAQEGTYTLTVTISDAGGATAMVSETATVGDASLTPTATNIVATEGATFTSAVATFTDADPAGTPTDYTATVDWGDKTALTTVSGSQITETNGVFSVAGGHTYAEEGTYTLTVTVADIGGAAATINPVAVVADAPLSATASAVNATEASTFSGPVATFSDANPAGAATDYTATIDWGDNSALTTVSGSLMSVAGGAFGVPGSHAYAEEGTYTLTVTISDVGGAMATVNPVATVGDAALTAGTGASIVATEGAAFSGVVGGFTDANSAAAPGDFTATITWSDGSTTQGEMSTISGIAGGFAVSGTHVFSDEAASAPFTVVVHDRGGSVVTLTGTAAVADAKLHLTAVATVSPAGGAANNLLVATFTDDGGPEPVANYSATIDWGDGATAAGAIALSNGVFQISGSHQYAKAGSFTIGVSVKDDGGSMDALVEATSIQLTPHQEYVIAVYHDVLDRAPDPGGLVYWAGQLDGGMAVSSVAEAIAHSDEYYAHFVIEPDYLKLLGRAADEAGVTYWTQKLQSGLTDQQLEAAFAASDEFYAQAGEKYDATGDADDTTIADLDHNADWIDAIYTLLLGRTADSSGETHWVDQLNAGMSRGQVALLIANSAENNSQIINGDYQHYLGRPADSAGLGYWLSQFADGETNEDVIAGFTGSAEYYQKHTSS